MTFISIPKTGFEEMKDTSAGPGEKGGGGMIGFILIGTFFLLLVMRIPVAASMGLASIAGMLYEGYGILVFPSVFYAAIAKYTLLAIPFLSWRESSWITPASPGASSILPTPAAVTARRPCRSHHRRGVLFAAISSSGPATVAAIGGVLIPAMVRNGY